MRLKVRLEEFCIDVIHIKSRRITTGLKRRLVCPIRSGRGLLLDYKPARETSTYESRSHYIVSVACMVAGDTHVWSVITHLRDLSLELYLQV
jgi:hypothetical protein